MNWLIGWFGNLKTWLKLMICFVIMIACLSGVVWLALNVIYNIRGDMEYALSARSLRNNANHVRLTVLQLILRHYAGGKPDNDSEDKIQDDADLKELKNTTDDTFSRLNQLADYFKSDVVAMSMITDLRQTVTAYTETRDKEQVPDILSHQVEKARAIALGVNAQRAAKIVELAAALAEYSNEVAAKRATTATSMFIAIGGLSVAIAIGLLAILNGQLAVPLARLKSAADCLAVGDTNIALAQTMNEDEIGALTRSFSSMAFSWKTMAESAKRVAGGDLSANLTPRSNADVFVDAFNLMVENVAQVTDEFTQAVEVVSLAASEILASANESAAGAAQTATAAHETSTIVEEVRQTSHLASKKARHVSDSAQRTAEITTVGRQATADIIEGMKSVREQVDLIAQAMVRLSEKSQSINGIIQAVDDIAIQSNLLALNASIEAARAGDLGSGFAVVAKEVRNLAQQSKLLTAQVRAIIEEIQQATSEASMATEYGGKAVDAALRQSDRAGKSIAVLAGSVIESAQAAVQIAVANQQQLVGVDQVATAMTSIRDACGDQLVVIRHVEAEANRLNEIGSKLKKVISRYQSWSKGKDVSQTSH